MSKSAQERVYLSSILSDLVDTDRRVENMKESCKNMGGFVILNRKRKELEEYLSLPEEEPKEEFLQAVKDLSKIHQQSSRGEHPDPSSVGKLYSKLSLNLPKFRRIKTEECTKHRDNPLSNEEMDFLARLTSRAQSLPAKKLKTGEFQSACGKMQNQILAAKNGLSKVNSLLQELDREIQCLPFMHSPEMKELEKTFLSHFKGVSVDIMNRMYLEENEKKRDWEKNLEELDLWFDTRKKITEMIITVSVANHKIASETCTNDDVESFRELSEKAQKSFAKLKLEGNMNRFMGYEATLESDQDPSCPVLFPFPPEQFIESLNDKPYDIAFDRIPCVSVSMGSDIEIVKKVYRFCTTCPNNSHFYIPKIFGMMKSNEEYILLFEYVPSLESTELQQFTSLISEEHKKEMIIGFSMFLETLSQWDTSLILYVENIKITKNCQIYIDPRCMASLFTIKQGTAVPKDLKNHPDTVMKRNFYCVYVGWLIETLVFEQVPSELSPKVMRKIPEDKTKGPFGKKMNEIIEKMYFPNNNLGQRPIVSAAQLISRMVTVAPSHCAFSPQLGREIKASVLNEDLKKVHVEFVADISVQMPYDVGQIDRSSDPLLRLNRYIQVLSDGDVKCAPMNWDFIMTKEVDATTKDPAYGPSVCKELVLDFFDLILRHPIFEEMGGKLFIAPKNSECKSCWNLSGKPCELWGTQCTYDAMGKATQLAMCLGVKWPKPLSRITIASLKDPIKTSSLNMISDVFPLVASLLNETEIYGPISRDTDGSLQRFDLGNVTEPFGIPNMVDLEKEFPELKMQKTVPMHLVSLYVTDFLDAHFRGNKHLLQYFREGLGEKASTPFWKIFSKHNVLTLENRISMTDTIMSMRDFMKFIALGDGFTDDDNYLDKARKANFESIMGNQENGHLRKEFLRAATGSNSFDPENVIKKVDITMEPLRKKEKENAERKLIDQKWKGVSIRACFNLVSFPYFETREELEMYIQSCICFSKIDLFTMQ